MSDVYVVFPNRLANVIEVNYLLGNVCFMNIEDANRRFVKVTQDPIPVYEKASKAQQQSRTGSGQSKRFSPAESSLYSSRIVDDTLFGKLRFFRIVDVSLYTSSALAMFGLPHTDQDRGLLSTDPGCFTTNSLTVESLKELLSCPLQVHKVF